MGFFLDTLEEELLSITSPIVTKNAKDDEAGTADNGWLEVGKKNRTATMRTVRSQPFFVFVVLMMFIE